MLNYHELTMNESRDSPSRHKQFLVICGIMTVFFVHGAVSAGLFSSTSATSLNIDFDGTFGGGEFVYKFLVKDYAASFGTIRTVEEDLKMIRRAAASEDESPLDWEEKGFDGENDLMHFLFLDEEGSVPGGKTRFAGGALLKKSDGGGKEHPLKLALLERNGEIAANFYDDGAGGVAVHSKNVQYQSAMLPGVRAVILRHPYSGGAFSALLQSYKIIPALRKHAEQYHEEEEQRSKTKKGGKKEREPLMVLGTCSYKQGMCTYYAPLVDVKPFFLGRLTPDEYESSYSDATFLQNWGVDFSNASKFLGWGGNNSVEKSASKGGGGGIDFVSVGKGLRKLLFGGGGGSTTNKDLASEEL